MTRAPHRLRLLAAGALALAACDSPGVGAQRRLYAHTDSMGVVPRDVVTIPLRERHAVAENSAAATSVTQPGVLFTINDSGNEPVLFALDTTGADRGSWRVRHARNVDWEAASVGPCADAAGRAQTGPPRCVYIGDTGDNAEARTVRAIYRVPEPTADGTDGVLDAERLTFRYPDRGHDVEAMYAAPDGSVYLISKRPLADAAGRRRPALVFRLPPGPWARHDTVVAELVDSLPSIVPGSAPMRLVTDAALSPDSRYVAVRTYAQVYVFPADSATGRVRASAHPSVCNIAELREPGGEGVGWLGTSGRLVLTSEGRRSPMHVVACPLP